MKKILMTIAALILILSTGTVSAFAAGPNNTTSLPFRGLYADFIDANDDGVCDNRYAGRGYGFTDADGDGVCDNQYAGRGYGFTDANDDGVCDNQSTGRGARHNSCRNI